VIYYCAKTLCVEKSRKIKDSIANGPVFAGDR
jgi:hypothetical protein